jgi:ATP-dependent Clp protease ATP-binding subunit ClpA
VFERFTDAARATTVAAQEAARARGDSWIGTEHLLLGVLAQPQAPGATALRAAGVTAEAVGDALPAPPEPAEGDVDADALQSLGIDLAEVRRRVESEFGPGALDAPASSPRRRAPWRRQGGSRLAFTDEAKDCLERSLRTALARRDRHIGTEHLTLALLDADARPAADLLRELGHDLDDLRARVLAEVEGAA